MVDSVNNLSVLSLAEAQASGRIQDFVSQEEARSEAIKEVIGIAYGLVQGGIYAECEERQFLRDLCGEYGLDPADFIKAEAETQKETRPT